MTEPARPVGWIAIAVAAPAAALVFAGSAAWAGSHDPLAEQRFQQATVDASVANQFPSAETVAAEQRVLELQQQLDDLNAKIDKVKAQTSRVKGSTPVIVYRPSAVSSGGGSSSPPASSGGTGGSK